MDLGISFEVIDEESIKYDKEVLDDAMVKLYKEVEADTSFLDKESTDK